MATARGSFVVKAAITNAGAKSFSLAEQKTMYRGKDIAVGDEIFVFASENEGGRGLIAKGIVTFVDHPAIKRVPNKTRYTPRVSVKIKRTATPRRNLGREELKPFRDLTDHRPQTELASRLYRQATNKIIGISGAAAVYLRRCF